jgi:hypothetical protein
VNINDIKTFGFRNTKVVVYCNSRHGDHYQSIQEFFEFRYVYASEGTFKCTKFPSSGHRRKNNKSKQQFTIGNFTILPFDIKHDVNGIGFLINHPDCGRTLYDRYSLL